MDPNAGNPFMQGGNPYMQPKPQTPVSGGEMDAGMAPPGGDGVSVTTKPRQLPGGAPPSPMGGDAPGMPLGPGGAGAPPPMSTPVPGQSTSQPNVPQEPQKSATARRLKMQSIRREIMVTNPEVPAKYAHAIAEAVVTLQAEAASPMGPLTQPGAPQAPHPHFNDDWAGQGTRARQRMMPHGDLNDPNHPFWRANGGHPFARSTVQTPNVQHGHPAEDTLAEDGDFVSQYGGRNPLEDHAFAQGYRGNNPHWYALTDKVMNAVSPRKPRQPAPPPVRG